ncbi:hypothetical protein AGLY_017663 [Aphis glycines]|uniref:Uncharacterized protein n=1 Tax=Aphis glycines TaxID=307491 RepID=A0A6G0SUE5_APHGL|nr:hypothetical protein AGLY_017663 [Aphis glycines]
MTILISLAEELHGPARKIFPRRSVVRRFKDDLWQADLIDMQPHSRQNNIHLPIYNYNNTKHSTIKCSPHEARINPVTIKRKTLQINTSNKLKFKINDKVRISNKGYTPNWTTEEFTISKILNTDPLTYQLKDSSNNIILGYFYTQELKKKIFFPDTFLIELSYAVIINIIFVLKPNLCKIFLSELPFRSDIIKGRPRRRIISDFTLLNIYSLIQWCDM